MELKGIFAMPGKPKLGQNFLRDEDAVARMVAGLGDITSSTVVEIGPGKGALTGALENYAGRLLLIELDPELAAGLRVQYAGNERVTLIEKSILHVDLSELAAGEKLVVIGNLPYYITSEILLHLAENHAAIDRAMLMVQREVAERVVAEPGGREYGLLTVTMDCYADASEFFTLPPEAFSPPPKVFSTVFRLRFREKLGELGIAPESEAAFLRFLKGCFAQKRKTLANNLRGAGLTTAAIEAALNAAGLDAMVRAEMLPLGDFAGLFLALRG
jgi:16S rRNA (adenine1518-N6/adenine1519-N6)-dimethyltransferase